LTDLLIIDVETETPHSHVEAFFGDAPSAASNNPPQQQVAGLPFSVPRSQLYYWTTRWQEDEQASLDELARGEGRSFPNAAEAIRWLLAPDEDA
jgi:hypothetical protein